MLLLCGTSGDDYSYIVTQEEEWKSHIYDAMLILGINWYPSYGELCAAGYRTVADQIRNYASHEYMRHEMSLLTKGQYQHKCIADPKKRYTVCREKTKWVRNSRWVKVVLIGENGRIMREALRRMRKCHIQRGFKGV